MGTPLEGIELLLSDEAGERLTEIRICHDFESTTDLIGQKDRGADGYVERWCTVPPAVEVMMEETGANTAPSP